MSGSSPANSRSLRPNRTPKRSQYFEAESSERDSDSDKNGEQSGYDSVDGLSASSIEEEEGADESDASEPPRKKQKGVRNRPSTGSSASIRNNSGTELWRTGKKTGLGPGTQVVFNKPKPRSPGKTPYKDERIHPNTLLFLKDLSKNNDREWLKMHDPDYRTSWKDFIEFLECLAPKVSEADETIPELPLKDCFFRIYRDVRFSPDQTPYKAQFSVAWSRTGRKGPYAAYYFQVKPHGGSFLGGGLWMPEAQALAKLRRNIDRKPRKIVEALTNPQIRKSFLGGIPADKEKAVSAFCKHNADSALKTKPRDYDADHEDIQLLRLRNFTLGCKLKDEEIVGPGALDRIAKLVEDLVPFVSYLNSVVMPDDPQASEGSAEDDDDDDDEESGE
ncbi:MAG: hypothetical protein Q9162_001230 [Coniocarpon cinnabarinum]